MSLRVASPWKGFAPADRSGNVSKSCSATRRASPTTPTSAANQRPILVRSASTWISGTCGSDVPKLVVRKFRLILASCCGNEERTYLLGERLDPLASAGAVCPKPSHDEWAGGL